MPTLLSAFTTSISLRKSCNSWSRFTRVLWASRLRAYCPRLTRKLKLCRRSACGLAQTCMAEVLAEHPDLEQAMEKAEKVKSSH